MEKVVEKCFGKVVRFWHARAVGLSSHGCVLVCAGVSVRSRGCVPEVAWVCP